MARSDAQKLELENLFKRVLEEEGGAIRNAGRLRDFVLQTDDGKRLRPTARETQAFLDSDAAGEERDIMQIYKNPPSQFYYAGSTNKPADDQEVFDLDLLDLNRRSPDIAQQRNEAGERINYVLVLQDRATRKLFTRNLTQKTPEKTREAFLNILDEQLRGARPIREINTDAGGEWSRDFAEELRNRGVNHRIKHPGEPGKQ